MSIEVLTFGVSGYLEGDDLGSVILCRGETPIPPEALYPFPIELQQYPASHLKVVNGLIVEKTSKEKEFADLPLKYKKQIDGKWVEMSTAEKQLADLSGQDLFQYTINLQNEQKMQMEKTNALKVAENKFLIMCDQLTNTTNHVKLGFDDIRNIIMSLPAEQQVMVSIQLLSYDAELKREGGNRWWDTCVWHSEVL